MKKLFLLSSTCCFLVEVSESEPLSHEFIFNPDAKNLKTFPQITKNNIYILISWLVEIITRFLLKWNWDQKIELNFRFFKAILITKVCKRSKQFLLNHIEFWFDFSLDPTLYCSRIFSTFDRKKCGKLTFEVKKQEKLRVYKDFLNPVRIKLFNKKCLQYIQRSYLLLPK